MKTITHDRRDYLMMGMVTGVICGACAIYLVYSTSAKYLFANIVGIGITMLIYFILLSKAHKKDIQTSEVVQNG